MNATDKPSLEDADGQEAAVGEVDLAVMLDQDGFKVQIPLPDDTQAAARMLMVIAKAVIRDCPR